jgi:DNA-binding NarL/FixJ family response regulator
MPSKRTGNGGNKRQVVIIEDQRLFAELLSHYCLEMGLEIAAMEATCRKGLDAVRRLRPELVLLDISLPDGDGLEVARVILAELPQSKVLGISAHRDPWTMLQVQRLGLHGFVDKQDQQSDVLKQAIQTVMSGRIYYAPVVNESSAVLRRDPKAFIRVLSDYEMRILSMIGESKTDTEIAAELGVSPTTIQSRRRDIMQKLDVHSTPKLIHYAIVNGLTRPEHLNPGPS